MKERKISTKVYKNILIAIVIMLYFISINFLYFRINAESLILVLKVVSSIIFLCGIIFIEISYNKDNGNIAIHALEILVLSGFTLSVVHVVKIKKLYFPNYILASSYIFSIYFIFKSIVIFTKEKKEYVDNLSDIKQIVDIKPEKREAKKRKKN